MANWAMTDYMIEGSHETLERINNAILHPDTSEGSEGWEGGVLKALGLDWNKNLYMRGFIQEEPSLGENTLEFYAEEAWGITDFYKVLEQAFPDIKVYYRVEECGCEIYATNDADGKYFPDKYYVDTCINSNYTTEYFKDEKSVWKWLSEISDGKVTNEEDVESFNESREDEGDFVYIHEFDVVE